MTDNHNTSINPWIGAGTIALLACWTAALMLWDARWLIVGVAVVIAGSIAGGMHEWIRNHRNPPTRPADDPVVPPRAWRPPTQSDLDPIADEWGQALADEWDQALRARIEERLRQRPDSSTES